MLVCKALRRTLRPHQKQFCVTLFLGMGWSCESRVCTKKQNTKFMFQVSSWCLFNAARKIEFKTLMWTFTDSIAFKMYSLKRFLLTFLSCFVLQFTSGRRNVGEKLQDSLLVKWYCKNYCLSFFSFQWKINLNFMTDSQSYQVTDAATKHNC